MQQLYTTFRRYNWLQSIATLILGALLLLFPNIVTNVGIAFIAAYIAIQGIIGLVAAIRAGKDDSGQDNKMAVGLSIGVIVLSVVFYLLAKPLLSSVPFFLGLILIFMGTNRMVNGFSRNRTYVNVTPWPMAVYGALLIIAGIVLVINPFGATMLVFRFFGGTMIAMVIIDFFNSRYYKKQA